MNTATAIFKSEGNFDWLYRALPLIMICFNLASCGQITKTDIKPHAAATTTPLAWSAQYPQNSHEFICGDRSVLIGRERSGKDENGTVRFRCATVQQFETLRTDSPEWSGNHDEHQHQFGCPNNTVMTGTSHNGDEEKPTRYHCSFLIDAWGNQIQPITGEWQREGDESSHTFECAANQVLTGRAHHDDEHAPTDYHCATLW